MCASVGKKWYFLREIWRDFFSYNNRFETRPFALFKTTFAQQASRGVFRALLNMYDEAFFSRKKITALFFAKRLHHRCLRRSWICAQPELCHKMCLELLLAFRIHRWHDFFYYFLVFQFTAHDHLLIPAYKRLTICQKTYNAWLKPLAYRT